jgi:hypothetical protein
MIDDGLFKRFPKPDVILGQHVMRTPRDWPCSLSPAQPPRGPIGSASLTP